MNDPQSLEKKYSRSEWRQNAANVLLASTISAFVVGSAVELVVGLPEKINYIKLLIGSGVSSAASLSDIGIEHHVQNNIDLEIEDLI